jgi:hypothetical protein
MNNNDIIKLLQANGYTIHPVFGFFYIPKKSLCTYFYINEKNIVTGKIKWGQITLSETKTLTAAQFQPSSYDLTTELDVKRKGEMMKRMAINRAKTLAMKEKGWVEPETPDEVPPAVE